MPIQHSVLNVKVLVGAFNQEKNLVGAFSFFVITNLRLDLCYKLYPAGAAERQLRVGVGQHEAALGEAVQGGGLQPPGAELVHILQHPDVGPGQPPI